jgi:hypothetical protein
MVLKGCRSRCSETRVFIEVWSQEPGQCVPCHPRYPLIWCSEELVAAFTTDVISVLENGGDFGPETVDLAILCEGNCNLYAFECLNCLDSKVFPKMRCHVHFQLSWPGRFSQSERDLSRPNFDPELIDNSVSSK